MRKDLIDLFFLELAQKSKEPARVILTGAAAATCYGHSRPSLDIDFEIRTETGPSQAYQSYLDNLIREISTKQGIAVDFSEDIGHWSMIDLLDYREKTIAYKKIGLLDIRVIAPEYWTIGKIARFYAIDVQDVIKVIHKKKLGPADLVDLWARALIASPLSLAKRQFIDHVRTFIKTYGKKAWGKSFVAKTLLQKFEGAIFK